MSNHPLADWIRNFEPFQRVAPGSGRGDYRERAEKNRRRYDRPRARKAAVGAGPTPLADWIRAYGTDIELDDVFTLAESEDRDGE